MAKIMAKIDRSALRRVAVSAVVNDLDFFAQ
jgi:hypothetical protein